MQSFITSNLGASKHSETLVNHQANLCNDCHVQDSLGDEEDERDVKFYKHLKKTNPFDPIIYGLIYLMVNMFLIYENWLSSYLVFLDPMHIANQFSVT